MEIKTQRILLLPTPYFLTTKTRLMTSSKESIWTRTLIDRLIIFTFMVLVGFSLAKAIQSQSVTGFILALVSLSAGIYFLYLLAKARHEQEQEETA